jgi:hypothetical protein
VPWIDNDVFALRIVGQAVNYSSYNMEALALAAAASLCKNTNGPTKIEVATDCQSLHKQLEMRRSGFFYQKLYDDQPFAATLDLKRNGTEQGTLFNIIVDAMSYLKTTWVKAHDKANLRNSHSHPNTFGNFVADFAAQGKWAEARQMLYEHRSFFGRNRGQLRDFTVSIEDFIIRPFTDNTYQVKLGKNSTGDELYKESAAELIRLMVAQRQHKYHEERETKRVTGHITWRNYSWNLTCTAIKHCSMTVSKTRRQLQQATIAWAFKVLYDDVTNLAYKHKIESTKLKRTKEDIAKTAPDCHYDTCVGCTDSLTHTLCFCQAKEIRLLRRDMLADLRELLKRKFGYGQRRVIEAIISKLETSPTIDSRLYAGLLPLDSITEIRTSHPEVTFLNITQALKHIVPITLAYAKAMWRNYCADTPTDEIAVHTPTQTQFP